VVRSDGVATDPVLYRGENAVEHFLASLQAELQEIREVLRNPADMVMTGTDKKPSVKLQTATYVVRR